MPQPGVLKNPQWLDEAEQTLHAIRTGAVDAFVVEEPKGHRVYALQNADLSYSAFVERMQQGAAILNARGEIIYCNPSLSKMLGRTPESIVGSLLKDFVDRNDQGSFQELLDQSTSSSAGRELQLRTSGKAIPAAFSVSLLCEQRLERGVLITDLSLQHQQRELASRLQRVQDEERRRLARELHDSVGQLLVAMSINTGKIVSEISHLSPEAARGARENSAMVQDIMSQIRTISHLLHPPLLDEVGLPSALNWLTQGFSSRCNIETRLEIAPDFPRLPQPVEIAIFRVVQECLTNVRRHSGSATCRVRLVHDHVNGVQIEIKDKGRGMDEAQISNVSSSGGVGLRGIQERIQKLGGKLEIISSGQGTTVKALLPVPRTAA